MHEIFIQNKEYLISYYGYIQVSLRRYGSEVFYAFHGQMDILKKNSPHSLIFFHESNFTKCLSFYLANVITKVFFPE